MRIAGIVQNSIVDGPGFRFTLFTQGCSHNCKGCHNPQTHDFNGGYEIDIDDIYQKIKKDKLLDGITFSGGDPMFQPLECAKLSKMVKELNLNVYTYTGFVFEDLLKSNNKDIMEFLKNIDVLIDGKYIEELKDLNLRFRGSSNQRAIDVAESLKQNKTILKEI